ncbi:PEGA domain-containing protein [Kribbella sp. NPDC055071]
MDENRRLFVLGGTVIVVALVVLGAFLVFRGGSRHTLTVSSIPNDLTLTVDGKQVAASGPIKLKEGQHTLTGERRGFESHTETVQLRQDSTYNMYLFSNSAEGRAWEKSNPGQELQLEGEAGRRYEELGRRLQAKYPILAKLPAFGEGFSIDQGVSQAHPGDPESLAFYVKVTYPEGRQNAVKWMTERGYKPETLELIYK